MDEKRPQSQTRKPASPTFSADQGLSVFPNAPHTGSCSRWSNSKAWSMGSKLKSHDTGRLTAPGPGAYTPGQYTFPLAPKYSLSPRRDLRDNSRFVPGPGAYDPMNPAHKGRNVALGVKLSYGSPYSVGKDTPGPADYNVDACTTFSTSMLTKGGMRAAPRFSFGLKPAVGGVYSAVNKGTPGPGTYESPKPKGLAYSMTPRSSAGLRIGVELAGDADSHFLRSAYDMRYGATRRGFFTSVRHSMHARVGRDKPPETPGPGQYEAPQQFWGAPLA